MAAASNTSIGELVSSANGTDLEEIFMNKEDLKSQESFMLALQTGLHKDLGTFHQIPPRETERDVTTIRLRTKSEGLSFMTKTLPSIAKSLDQALLSGTFLCPTSFKRYKGTKLPCFMHRFFVKVFSHDGVLLEEPDVAAICDIRQAGYLFYKYQLPYPDRLVSATIREFLEDDRNIKPLYSHTAELTGNLYYAKEVLKNVFETFEFTQERPKNGPGSVANGLKPWQRYRPSRYYKSLDRLIPYYRMYYCSDNHLFDRWDEWFGLEHGNSLVTARLIAVPKDSRGPRLISSEHSEFMTYQQCLRQEIVPFIETHSLTGRQVNFTDQQINGELALEGSRTGGLATLDLSKASDLLSLDLVDELFEDTPIHDYIMNTRSSATHTPLGDQIFRKFAPMGSALCFPIQAISFYALLVGRMVANGERLGVAARKVWVYGDDIIVPTHFVPDAIDVLESVGLKINRDKSCYTGKFRESCGVDAYNGIDITPVKIKKLWNIKPDAQSTVAWVTMCNNLFARGYWITADVIRRKIQKHWKVNFPLCTESSPIIGYNTWSLDHALSANRSRLKWNRHLQCWTIRAKIVHNRTKPLLHDGWKRMLRYGWERSQLGIDLPDYSLPFDGEQPFSTDAFVVRNTTQIKYSLVTEAAM